MRIIEVIGKSHIHVIIDCAINTSFMVLKLRKDNKRPTIQVEKRNNQVITTIINGCDRHTLARYYLG